MFDLHVQNPISHDDLELLFGEGETLDSIFESMDCINKDGQVMLTEVLVPHPLYRSIFIIYHCIKRFSVSGNFSRTIIMFESQIHLHIFLTNTADFLRVHPEHAE